MRKLLSSILFAVIITLFIKSEAFAANSSIFTASLWVKPDTSVASKAIVGKAEEMRVFTDASGYVGCQIKTTTWQTGASSTSALSLNSWSHVACTYDKINLRVYVNGVQVGSTSLTTAVDDTAAVLRIGQDDSSDALYANFSGITDNFQFYNYARTVEQLTIDMGGDHPAVSGAGGSSVGAGSSRPSAPLAWWKFNEGFGTTANNAGSQGSTLNGTLSGTTVPSWTSSGKFGKALSFNGTTGFVSVGASIPTNSVSFWINPTSNTASMINLTSSAYITASSGTITATGFTTPSYYINGKLTSTPTLIASAWNHIVVTSATQITANTFTIGKANGAFTTGTIDEVKIYNYALTSDEVKLDYNRGSALVLGSSNTDSSNVSSNSSASGYCPPGNAEANCAAGLNPSPVGEWNFEEGSGLSAQDTSGNANTGTLGIGSSAPTWTTGKIGKALSFDGIDDKITISLVSLSSYTISGWIKPNQQTDSYGTIISQAGTSGLWYRGSGAGGNQNKLDLYYSSTDHFNTTALSQNIWQHISIVNDNGAITFYLNGKSDGTASGAPASAFINIGNDPSNERFKGQMDNFRVYSYARSPAQVAWDYNNGKPVANWKMDECQGTTTYSSSTPYTSTLNGTLTLGASPAAGTCDDGTGTTAWNLGASGKYNASLNFDGSDDFVSVGTSIPTNSVSFWIKPTSNTASMINLTSTSYITSTSGTISATGLTSPSYYVNGQLTSTPTLTANAWNHVVVTTTTSITANTFTIGKANGAYTAGLLDSVQIYNYALTAQQVKLIYNQNSAVRFGPATGAP